MDAQQALEIKNSTHWTELCKELDSRIFLLMAKLTICKPEELVSIQEEIKHYQAVKRLPDDIIDREE